MAMKIQVVRDGLDCDTVSEPVTPRREKIQTHVLCYVPVVR